MFFFRAISIFSILSIFKGVCMKISDNFPKKIPKGIKTRYDDIQQDILQEKIDRYIKSIMSPEPKTFRKLGDIIGNKLDKII